MTPDAAQTWAWPARYEFFETTRLLRTGGNDPVVRREPDGLWRTARTEAGPATVRVRVEPEVAVRAEAWGEGAGTALAEVPAWLGLERPPWSLPPHPLTDRLLREHSGLRLNDTGDVFEALLITILQQQVTWEEAVFTWRRLVEELGEPAPGPAAGLRLIPTPRSLRASNEARLVALGIGRQRARTLLEVAFVAKGLQRAAELPSAAAARLLEKARGVGPWTSASVLGMRLGRPEPVLRGDVHFPHTVCWAFAGEPRGSEARMQELLAPFQGHAFQVLRLLYAARIEAPRRGPKREPRFGRRG